MESIIEQVRVFADQSHGDQQRKFVPDRYIVHPVRVMETCRGYLPVLPVLAAALLHDVLEDTPVTEEKLYDFLLSVMDHKDADETISLVVELTDVYTKSAYRHLNRRQRKEKEADRMRKISAAAQTIKYADILDNMKEISSQDDDFAPVYIREAKRLLQSMTKGNTALYQRVLRLIREEEEVLSRRENT